MYSSGHEKTGNSHTLSNSDSATTRNDESEVSAIEMVMVYWSLVGTS